MLFQSWFDKFNTHPETESVVRFLDEGQSLWASGVWGAARSFVAAALLARLRRPGLFICNGESEAASLAEELRFFLQGFPSLSDPSRKSVFHEKLPTLVDPETDPLVYFPAYGLSAIEAVGGDDSATTERLLILNRLAAGEPLFVVCSRQACTQALVPAEVLLPSTLVFEKGREYSLEQAGKSLLRLGYLRESMVEEAGQYSVRGGILDLYPPNREKPIRLEFEGDRLDNLREFDPATQRSSEELARLSVLPVHEVILDEDLRKAGIEKILGSGQQADARLQAVERLRDATRFAGQQWLAPIFYPRQTLFDYLSNLDQKPFLVVDQPQQIQEALEKDRDDADRVGTLRKSQGQLFPKAEELYLDWKGFHAQVSRFPCLYTSLLAHTLPEFKRVNTKALTFKSHDITRGDLGLLTSELLVWLSRRDQVVVVSQTHGDLQRFGDLLARENYRPEELKEGHGPEVLGEASVGLSLAKLEKGFFSPTLGLVLLSDQEVFPRAAVQAPRVYRRRAAVKGARPIESFAELKQGQFAVHVDHGIGIFRGILRLNVEGHDKDFVCLEYQDAEKLYVPADQVNLVQKYLGGDEAPKLYKLGGTSWASVREKVKESVTLLARELLETGAKRQVAEIAGFGPDTAWQKTFEETFPFTETDDQLKAIEEVKRDLEGRKPMDRLLCGDVGFGKTEVALRAAFKAVMAGYQVAVLVPTTILAQQHYNTFTSRLADFPVRVAMLSRFKSGKEQKQIVQALAEGRVDLVVGTHRLLQKDIAFKKLGLMVIDEEQRFGVAHKERLKKFRAQVEVLAMSATPIPRTLHFSLSGLRDMSVIETPPLDRLPIRTYVLEDNQAILREAILQELRRGGQVFFVHNRVRDIERVAEKLRALVPEAHVAVGHGQMDKHELEKVMLEFLGKAHDVLVATTIIESGLDIPNVNTILINHSEDFGLSQLYQLRGRVGRAERQAYAYLFYPKDRSIPEVAEKRLAAIEEFTDLGAGFRVAMRDLEIRGTGNILGPQQHGHVAAVGFDLYCHLLNEAVAQLKGQPIKQERTPSLQLDLDAYIPETYLPDPRQKMELYKRLAAVEEEKELEALEAEVADRFGPPVAQVSALFEAVQIRLWAKKLGLGEVVQKGNQVTLRFFAETDPGAGFVARVLEAHRGRVRFLPGPPPGLQFQAPEPGLSWLKRLLPGMAAYVNIPVQELARQG
jgi:transcription-repair coupling factor (superfamily II helicase)